VPATSALLNRFLHHARMIAIGGRIYRLKDQALGEKACQPKEQSV